MGELTPCNHCSLNGIKWRAKQKGLKVTVRSEDGGTMVYVHPPEVTEFPRRPDGEPSKYFVAWLMGVTDHCVC